MATWADRINNGAIKTPTNSSLEPFPNAYNPQVSQMIKPNWASRINAGVTVKSNPLNISNPQPPAKKGKIGDLFKDPKTQVMWEYSNSGWKIKPLASDSLKKSIVSSNDPNHFKQVKAEEVKPESNKAEFKIDFGAVYKSIEDNVKNYFKDLGNKDKRKETIKKTGEGVVQLGKDVLRAFPRAATSTALSITGKDEITPGEGFKNDAVAQAIAKTERFFLGVEKIKNIRKTGEDTAIAFGGNKKAVEQYGLPIGFAMVSLDLIPGFSKKKLADVLAKQTEETAIKATLKKSFKELPDEVAQAMAHAVSPMKNSKEIEQYIDFYTKVNRRDLYGKALITPNDEILKGRQQSLIKSNEVKPFIRTKDNYIDDLDKSTTERVLKNPNKYKDEYIKRYGNEVNTDLARNLFPEYKGINQKSVQNASAGVRSIVYDDLLNTKKGFGNNTILTLSGGSGSGKSTALKMFGDKKKYPVVLDTTLSSDSSVKLIKDQLEKGYKSQIVYVLRNPKDAWKGVINRLKTEPRPVEEDYFIKAHQDSQKQIIKLYDEFKDNPNVSIEFIDNTGLPKDIKTTTIDFVRNYSYNIDEVVKDIENATEQALKTKQINQEFYQALKGEKRGATVGGQPKAQSSEKVNPTSIVDEVKQGFEAGRQARKEAEKSTKGTVGQKLRTETIDRLTPVFEFVKRAGKELPTEQNPYRKMRLLAGISGQTEAYLARKVAPILKKEKDQLEDLAVLWTLEREKELVGRGLTRKRTLEQIEQGIEELRGIKGDKFNSLEQSVKDLRKVGDETLDSLHKAGIISDESFDAIKKNNQFYAPMEAVEHIADNLEKGNFGNGSFNVASQDVIKTIKDYSGDVANPIEAFIRQIPKAQALVEKNKAIQSLVELRNKNPEIYENLIVPLKGGGTPKDMGVINVFEKGQNVRYGVPEAVADAVKNLDAESAGILVKLGSIQAKILRAGATGLNIGFIPVNIIRDFQDALTTELTEKGVKAMLQFLASYPEAIFSSAGKGKLWREWAEAGGLSSTMTEQIFKNPTKSVDELAGKKSLKSIISTTLNTPKALVEFANRVGEQSTRLARFKSGISRGESIEEAAFKSRDISLDFAKAGNKVKVLNQVIPFLNAGIQGSEKLFRLYKNNPKSAIASTGLVFGLPAVGLYTYNSQFKDFDDIPNSERQDNWIIIARDRTEEEKSNGDKVIGIKIPKGFLGRMVANTVDSSMDFMRKKDPEAFGKAILDSVAGLSPVGLPYNEEKLGQSVSGLLPPWIQASLEATSNTNFYFNQPIVPKNLEDIEPKEQYKKTTPKIYKLAGELTGLSPLILENTVNTTTGGLGAQGAQLLSGDIEKGTIGQITRRFSGVRSGEATNNEFDEVAKFATDSKTESLKQKRQAEKLWEDIKTKAKPEMIESLKYVKKTDPILFDKLKDTIEEEKLGLTSLERFVKTLPVEDGARAKYLYSNYKKLETKEEKKEYLVNLLKKKIVSKNVLKQIIFLKSKDQTS